MMRSIAAVVMATMLLACGREASAPSVRSADGTDASAAPAAGPAEMPAPTRGPDDPPLVQRDGRTRVDLELTRKKAVAATLAVPPGFVLQTHERRTTTWAIEAPDTPPWVLTLQAGCAGTCSAKEIGDNVERHLAQLRAVGVTPEFEKVLALAAVTMQTETVLDERIDGARLWVACGPIRNPAAIYRRRPSSCTASLHPMAHRTTSSCAWSHRPPLPPRRSSAFGPPARACARPEPQPAHRGARAPAPRPHRQLVRDPGGT